MAKPRKPKSGVSSLAPQDIHRYPRIIQDIYIYVYIPPDICTIDIWMDFGSLKLMYLKTKKHPMIQII